MQEVSNTKYYMPLVSFMLEIFIRIIADLILFSTKFIFSVHHLMTFLQSEVFKVSVVQQVFAKCLSFPHFYFPLIAFSCA